MVGRAVDEEREAESKRVSVGVDGVALIKVDWLLRGIVRDEGGIFALVAKSAEEPLRRLRRAPLCLAASVWRASLNKESASFSQDGNTQGFERKLYAPCHRPSFAFLRHPLSVVVCLALLAGCSTSPLQFPEPLLAKSEKPRQPRA